MIEVGEYIRTEGTGLFRIAKVVEFNKDLNSVITDISNFLWINVANIKSHSHNLIDLIEVGDYVNGSKVYRIYEPNVGNMYERRVTIEEDDVSIGNEQITSIVTKEQFKSMEYKVGGEDD